MRIHLPKAINLLSFGADLDFFQGVLLSFMLWLLAVLCMYVNCLFAMDGKFFVYVSKWVEVLSIFFSKLKMQIKMFWRCGICCSFLLCHLHLFWTHLRTMLYHLISNKLVRNVFLIITHNWQITFDLLAGMRLFNAELLWSTLWGLYIYTIHTCFIFKSFKDIPDGI